MRYLKKYENHEDIHAICQKYGIANYTINKDRSIDVDGDVILHDSGSTKLPLNFGNVRGNFDCVSNNLWNLEGCPKSVSGNFYCFFNQLTNLEGCSKSVEGHFSCSVNRLTSLMWCPKSVGDDFNCRNNRIETFEGLDFVHIGGDFNCEHNPIWMVWNLFKDHTKFEFFNDCDIIRENRVIILERLNFFLDYIGKETVTEVEGYKCI
jgi:hypothetical protein